MMAYMASAPVPVLHMESQGLVKGQLYNCVKPRLARRPDVQS